MKRRELVPAPDNTRMAIVESEGPTSFDDAFNEAARHAELLLEKYPPIKPVKPEERTWNEWHPSYVRFLLEDLINIMKNLAAKPHIDPLEAFELGRVYGQLSTVADSSITEKILSGKARSEARKSRKIDVTPEEQKAIQERCTQIKIIHREWKTGKIVEELVFENRTFENGKRKLLGREVSNSAIRRAMEKNQLR